MRYRTVLLSVVALFLSLIALDCRDMGSEIVSSLLPSGQTQAPPPDTISFQRDLLPLFDHYGCTGCHGGTNGLFVGTVHGLLAGGFHGPAVVTGDSAASMVLKKLSAAQPFGDRMPQGGPYLPDSSTHTLAVWIEQGARDN